MRFAGLYSGGKDSTFAIAELIQGGHTLCCLIVVHPQNDESMLFHYPSNKLLGKIAQVMSVPVIEVYCESTDTISETLQLENGVKKAVTSFPIQAISHGCISSNFQFNILRNICNKYRLNLLSPIWHIESEFYYNKLLNQGYNVLITRVAALGLDSRWIGKTITFSNYLELKRLSERFGFNITFEGGEAETLVLDCPLYQKRVVVKEGTVIWDGVRGIFEISEVDLIQK